MQGCSRTFWEVPWNLAVVLCGNNICAKIVGNVKIAPCSVQRQIFVENKRI